MRRQYPLAYADAFAVAPAQKNDATLVTRDPEMKAVEGQTRIEWLE
jgi:predicted nucleic acid-binding protein